MREQISRRLDEVAARREVEHARRALGAFGRHRPEGKQRFAGRDARALSRSRVRGA